MNCIDTEDSSILGYEDVSIESYRYFGVASCLRLQGPFLGS